MRSRCYRKGSLLQHRILPKASAKEYVERIASKIILIQWRELVARYMIDHNVGVSIEKTYEIKRVDSDYFAQDPENS